MSEDEPERVGGVAEEAAKLLGALRTWAQENAGDASSAVEGATRATSGMLHDLNGHVATGGADCRYCPVCQVIAAVRETSPEVREHLATAATSLMHAAAGALEAHTQRAQRGTSDPTADRRGPVEKIDLSDDAVGWEE